MTPYIRGRRPKKDRAGISIWSRNDRPFKDGKDSHTFTVEDINSVDELETFIKAAIDHWEDVTALLYKRGVDLDTYERK